MQIIQHEEMHDAKYIKFKLTTKTEKKFFKNNASPVFFKKFPEVMGKAIENAKPPAILRERKNRILIRTLFGDGYGYGYGSYCYSSQFSVEEVISYMASEGFISNNPFS